MIGNFSSTYERGKIANFSRPFLLNYGSILTTVDHQNNIFIVIGDILTGSSKYFFLFIFLFFIFNVFLLSYSDTLTKEKGLVGNAYYVLASVFRVVRFKSPENFLSRWALLSVGMCSVLLFSIVPAVLTNALIKLDQPTDPFVKMSDLKDKKFIFEEGHYLVGVIKSLGGFTKEIRGLDNASSYYYNNRDVWDGFVADYVLIHQLDKDLPSPDIIQSKLNLRNDELVFVYSKNFPYDREVDGEIMRLQDANVSLRLCAKYLGADSKLCIL